MQIGLKAKKNFAFRLKDVIHSSSIIIAALQRGSCTVLESMRAREPGLQAPSNLTGSKIKNTFIFLPLLILSERYEIQYLEEHLIW